MKYRGRGAWVTAMVLLADQLHKWVMLELVNIDARPPIEVMPFFNLVMVWNPGVSFGLFGDHEGERALFLILLALVIVVALAVWLWRCADGLIATALALVIGGALGNVIDRVRFGAVADFFDFHAYGWHYPAFNIADAAIFIGVCLLLYDGFWRQKGPQ